MLNVDEILSEFRERFQKMENSTEICRICCQMLRKFPESSETVTEEIIHYSFPVFNSRLRFDLLGLRDARQLPGGPDAVEGGGEERVGPQRADGGGAGP